MRVLAKDSAWVRNHENIFVIGRRRGQELSGFGTGPNSLNGYSALYRRTAALSRELALARADGSLRHFLARLARIDVLVID
ncbi:MAG TPA: ATP-binding protein [Terriglobales bacterium]|nr:ATP-binding protein [Terriglobales bacterium]